MQQETEAAIARVTSASDPAEVARLLSLQAAFPFLRERLNAELARRDREEQSASEARSRARDAVFLPLQKLPSLYERRKEIQAKVADESLPALTEQEKRERGVDYSARLQKRDRMRASAQAELADIEAKIEQTESSVTESDYADLKQQLVEMQAVFAKRLRDEERGRRYYY
jgi:hypothetical protein